MNDNSKKVMKVLSRSNGNRPGFEKCIGCRVCTLPCPVWQQTHDITLTLCGRARAIQCDTSPEDIKESIMACILCGACESVCPFGIDSLNMTMGLRNMLNGNGSVKYSSTKSSSAETHAGRLVRRMVLPGKALRSNELLMNRIHDFLLSNNTALADDDGDDIRLAIESGVHVSESRMQQFIEPLSNTVELIVSDGVMHKLLRKLLPNVKIISIGMALLNKSGAEKLLGPSDLYIIEARAYNSCYKDMVSEYDLIRRLTGCQMNIDLHRSAIPTGSANSGSGAVSSEEQVRWIVKGRRFDRVVVESPEDIEVFKKVTKADVIHILELVKSYA